MKTRENKWGRWLTLSLGVVLFVLHQDQWFWNDDRLVFGFMPVGLAYHAAYSFAAAGLWALAAWLAWPAELEAFACGEDAHQEPPA